MCHLWHVLRSYPKTGKTGLLNTEFSRLHTFQLPLPSLLASDTCLVFLFVLFLLLVNYLIDEACNTGKGGNTIISLIHHFPSCPWTRGKEGALSLR